MTSDGQRAQPQSLDDLEFKRAEFDQLVATYKETPPAGHPGGPVLDPTKVNLDKGKGRDDKADGAIPSHSWADQSELGEEEEGGMDADPPEEEEDVYSVPPEQPEAAQAHLSKTGTTSEQSWENAQLAKLNLADATSPARRTIAPEPSASPISGQSNPKEHRPTGSFGRLPANDLLNPSTGKINDVYLQGTLLQQQYDRLYSTFNATRNHVQNLEEKIKEYQGNYAAVVQENNMMRSAINDLTRRMGEIDKEALEVFNAAAKIVQGESKPEVLPQPIIESSARVAESIQKAKESKPLPMLAPQVTKKKAKSNKNRFSWDD